MLGEAEEGALEELEEGAEFGTEGGVGEVHGMRGIEAVLPILYLFLCIGFFSVNFFLFQDVGVRI